METTKKQFDWKWIRIAATWLFILALLFGMFHYRNLAYKGELARMTANDSLTYLSNENKTLTASVETLQVTAGDLKDQPAKDKELQKLTGRFSKVTSITTIKAQAKLDSAIAVFDTPIVLRPAQSDSTKTESFERVGTVWEDWFCANYRIDNKGIILTQVTGDISVTTVTGFKRKWFLGKTTAVTDVTPTSKNVTVLQIQSTEVIVPRTWWKEIASFAIGAYAGYQLKN